MHRAMAEASVGGDALANEDPIVLELEETCAEMFRKEAALFVCSGMMGNLVSLLTISHPGCTVIADPYTHIISSEMAGFQRLGECTLVPVETDGILTGDLVRQCLDSHDIKGDNSAVICAENTHGLRGGIAWGADVTAGLVEVARERRLRLHIDGARIFNAAVAMSATVADLTTGADTVQVCLSKGLAVPFGSLVLGSRETIDRAREYRQMLGGGMHKPGIMAAAGLVALGEMPSQILADHRRARRLADLLSGLEGLTLAHPVHTNIIDLAFDPEAVDGEQLVACAAERSLGITGPWTGSWGHWIRLVTHHKISDGDIEEAVGVLGEALKESERPKE